MNKQSMKMYYSIRELSVILGVDYQTMYKMVSTGEIPSLSLSKKLIRIKKADFELWLESKAVSHD